MTDIKKISDKSPLVATVIALSDAFENLERIGTKIDEMELKTDTDYEQARRWLARFAENGEVVTTEIGNLSRLLSEARVRSEAISAKVEARAAQIGVRRDESQELADEFNALTLQVRDLGADLNDMKREDGSEITDADRAAIAQRLGEVQNRLEPMIAEAKRIQQVARQSRMKALEQNADSLAQTLGALRSKLTSLDLPVLQ